jgi:transcriptional regulator with XRE-family HTH domain
MKDRIILLIKAKNLTAAQFADEIGVQKSSISHIISGRNNASLDFIQKVLLRYPEVNMEWLMVGKGPLFKGAENTSNISVDALSNAGSTLNLPPVDLFSELNPGQRTEFRNENDLNPLSKPEDGTTNADAQKATLFTGNEKKEQILNYPLGNHENIKVTSGDENAPTKSILKIVEFYSDNTYKEYFPE